MHLSGTHLSSRSAQFVAVVLGLGATRNPHESQNTKRSFLGTESFCTFAQLEDSSCRQLMKEFKSRMSFSAFFYEATVSWAGIPFFTRSDPSLGETEKNGQWSLRPRVSGPPEPRESCLSQPPKTVYV
ncbi:hypothetical protein E2C01_095992 [Portunus trituberculatus]|uniref:Uncharacterized protein n=1 Tax=Portunus trituberculatus TaxID=210409 RepID=A0A5B7K1V8_PORTR|nr:hypothetical protein [Portunus trituberculatus]